jgi:hypothetical protein
MGLIVHTKSSVEALYKNLLEMKNRSLPSDKQLDIKTFDENQASQELRVGPLDPEKAKAIAQNTNSVSAQFIGSNGTPINLAPLKCETFPIEDFKVLLGVQKITHIRIYMGVQEEGNSLTGRPVSGNENAELKKTHHCLIIVPIVNGKEQISNAQYIREYGYPCPPICDPNSGDYEYVAPRELNPR